MFKKIALFSLLLALSFGLSQIAKAEDATADTAALAEELTSQAVATENAVEITAEDLGIKTGLWSSFWRELQLTFTTNQIRKAELQMEKAGIQLLKAKQLAITDANNPALAELLTNADNKYQTLVAAANARLEKIKTANPDDPRLKNFLDKYADQNLKHQAILEKLKGQVPAKVYERIEARRLVHLKNFGAVMNKLENREQFKNRLKNALENKGASIENRLKHLERLEEWQNLDPTLKAEVEEIKTEAKTLWTELKKTQTAIQQNREELKTKIEAELKANKESLTDPAARQAIMTEIRDERVKMIQENQTLRDKAHEKIQTFKSEAKPILNQVKTELKDDRPTNLPAAIKERLNTQARIQKATDIVGTKTEATVEGAE